MFASQDMMLLNNVIEADVAVFAFTFAIGRQWDNGRWARWNGQTWGTGHSVEVAHIHGQAPLPRGCLWASRQRRPRGQDWD